MCQDCEQCEPVDLSSRPLDCTLVNSIPTDTDACHSTLGPHQPLTTSIITYPTFVTGTGSECQAEIDKSLLNGFRFFKFTIFANFKRSRSVARNVAKYAPKFKDHLIRMTLNRIDLGVSFSISGLL